MKLRPFPWGYPIAVIRYSIPGDIIKHPLRELGCTTYSSYNHHMLPALKSMSEDWVADMTEEGYPFTEVSGLPKRGCK